MDYLSDSSSYSNQTKIRELNFSSLNAIDTGSGGIGKCDVLPSFVNPLKLKDRSLEANSTNSFLFFPGDKFVPSEKSTSLSKGQYNRVRRDVEMTVIPETYTDKDGKKYKVVKMVSCLVFVHLFFSIPISSRRSDGKFFFFRIVCYIRPSVLKFAVHWIPSEVNSS